MCAVTEIPTTRKNGKFEQVRKNRLRLLERENGAE